MAPAGDSSSIPPLSRNSSTTQVPGTQPATPSQHPLSSSRPTSTTASRRTSQIFPMSPPPLPLASPGGSIPTSVQHAGAHAFPPLSPVVGSHSNVDMAGVPMRHPRPLTAAELHLELEKEQEAVVNRLTRELSALRAHSASVASTASSNTSGVLLDVTDPNVAHTGALTGPTHPTASRRHRSSSSVSRTSISTGAPYNTYSTGIPLNPATVNIPHSHHRYSVSSQNTNTATGSSDPSSVGHRSASVVSTPRYEEVAHYRHELEEAKKENEMLKRRIRELERRIAAGGGTATGGETGPRGRRGVGNAVLNGAGSGAAGNGENGAR